MKLQKCLNNVTTLFLCFITFSLLGWLYETSLFYILYGKYYDRGYLSLPLCPIYGSTVIVMFLIFGTVNNPSKFTTFIESKTKRIITYITGCFLLPTTVELGVGYYFHKYKNIRLWDYSYMPLNINGYVCLGYSVFWTILIYVAMNYIFPIIRHLFDKMNVVLKSVISLFFIVLIIVDLIKISH